MGDNVGIHYHMTKKVAMVSPRDQYLVVCNRFYEAADSPSGKKLLVLASKSRDGEMFPCRSEIVRAKTLMGGYLLEEVEEGKIEATFMVESDYKIS